MSNIPERIRLGMIAAMQEMREGWGRQAPDEMDRLVGFVDYQVQAISDSIARTLTPMIDDFLSSGRGYFRCAEKGIAIKDGAVTVTLTAERDTVPDELYTHRGRFLVIIADDVASLEELNRQADLFGFGELEPIDAAPAPKSTAYLASAVEEVPAAELDLDGWLASFREIIASQSDEDFDLDRYAPGTPHDQLLRSYIEYGWSPWAACMNELAEEPRLIVDGPLDVPGT